MCVNPFAAPKVKTPEAPEVPKTDDSANRAQEELRRRLASRSGTSATFLTSPLGAGNFGGNVRKATLLGGASPS